MAAAWERTCIDNAEPGRGVDGVDGGLGWDVRAAAWEGSEGAGGRGCIRNGAALVRLMCLRFVVDDLACLGAITVPEGRRIPSFDARLIGRWSFSEDEEVEDCSSSSLFDASSSVLLMRLDDTRSMVIFRSMVLLLLSKASSGTGCGDLMG